MVVRGCGFAWAFQIGEGHIVCAAYRLADYERNRRKCERIFLSALFSATTSAARAGCYRRSGPIAFRQAFEISAVRNRACITRGHARHLTCRNTLALLIHVYCCGSGKKNYPGDFFSEMPHFAQRIEEVTPENKPVFIFGSEPELLFYAHRRSATRYIFLFPLSGPMAMHVKSN